jgi:hypothetical protein
VAIFIIFMSVIILYLNRHSHGGLHYFFKYSGVSISFMNDYFYWPEEGNLYFRIVVVCYIVTMEKVQIIVSDKARCTV